jgi:hypothetical protein
MGILRQLTATLAEVASLGLKASFGKSRKLWVPGVAVVGMVMLHEPDATPPVPGVCEQFTYCQAATPTGSSGAPAA